MTSRAQIILHPGGEAMPPRPQAELEAARAALSWDLAMSRAVVDKFTAVLKH